MKNITITCDLCQKPIIELHGEDVTPNAIGTACCSGCSTSGEWYINGFGFPDARLAQFICDDHDDDADWWKR